jgi:NTP pyrophosphatase (non-canonical NTP hydrolase)
MGMPRGVPIRRLSYNRNMENNKRQEIADEAWANLILTGHNQETTEKMLDDILSRYDRAMQKLQSYKDK